MSELITFYDLPCAQGIPWSPNTWRLRFVLNLKKIPYKTVWLEFPDIEPTLKELGIAHTYVKPSNDKPHYTVPAISDPNNPDPVTGLPTRIADSWKIAQYLDERYPDPPLFPNGTFSVQNAFEPTLQDMDEEFYMIIIQDTYQFMNPASQPFYRSTRELSIGKKLEEFIPESERKEALEKGEKAFDKVDKIFEATAGGEKEGLFFSDKQTVYADFCLAGKLMWLKVMGRDSVWPSVKTWNEGRWDRFLSAMEEKYGKVV